MSEYEEVARSILRAMVDQRQEPPLSVRDALRIVRREMPNEGDAVLYAVADALYFMSSRIVVA